MHVVLVEPEIPQNTGSVARLCAATRTPLHLVGRLGFSLEDRYLKRAGLDYWPLVHLQVHHDWPSFLEAARPLRLVGFSSHGADSFTALRYQPEDALVFGGESQGLPEEIRSHLAPLYRIPIAEPRVRSLNLANAVSIVLFEGLRQLGRC